jgi:hypothetical protein
MAKVKTNRQVLINLIKELDDVQLVILRERILAVSESVITQKDEIRESMKNSIIHPDLYINTMQKTFDLTDFKD